MSRRRNKKKVEGLTGNEWLATYADTITNLLTFFILLYSFSSVNEKKFQEIAYSFQSVLGVSSGSSLLELNDGETPIVGGSDLDVADPDNMDAVKLEMYNSVLEFIEQNNLETTVEVKEDDRGVIIQLKDNILFESGKSDLIASSMEVLGKISSLIATFPNKIIIEGHTDNVPMKSALFDSNWELSTSRAVRVVRYFIENTGLDPKRFTAAGYGEFMPISDNITAEGRSRNRRVNILIVATLKEESK